MTDMSSGLEPTVEERPVAAADKEPDLPAAKARPTGNRQLKGTGRLTPLIRIIRYSSQVVDSVPGRLLQCTRGRLLPRPVPGSKNRHSMAC
jgi:hypothetical protein